MAVLLFNGSPVDAKGGSVSVKGYYRSNGTYVQPYTRSAPDSNPYNNYSFPGNINPYTGKVATGNPDTYLDNYYNKGSSSGSTYIPALIPTTPSIGIQPSTSSYTTPSVSAPSPNKPRTCTAKFGPNAAYYTDIGRCECVTGYAWNNDKTDCVYAPPAEKVALVLYQRPIVPAPTRKYNGRYGSSGKMTFTDRLFEPDLVGLLVKAESDNKVYIMDANLCLKWVTNEYVAYRLFNSPEWNKTVNTIDDALLSTYKFCGEINQ